MLDGLLVPSGTTIMSGSVVKTQAEPAAIHVKGHTVMQLAPNSVAAFALTPQGSVKVSVQSGQLAYASSSGKPALVAANDSLVLAAQQSGQPLPVTLSRDFPAGSRELVLNHVGGLKPGQKIRIGDELVEIRSVDPDDNVIVLASPTKSAHPAGSMLVPFLFKKMPVAGWLGLIGAGALETGLVVDDLLAASPSK